MKIYLRPRPIFDDKASLETPLLNLYARYPSVCKYFESFQSSIDVEKDYVCARKFLLARCVEPNTFPNYRNYIERILLWSWIYAEKSPLALSVNDIRDFVSFNEHPANDWVGSCPRQRFTDNEGYIDFNDAWRPMRNRRSKAMGNCIKIDDEDDSTFQCVTSVSCMVQLLSACSSFYNYMIEIGVGKSNPAALLSKRYANRLRSTKKIGHH